ncbi:conserved hypothetical protein [Burkholderiales bacterium 8X]|nr:conserved hypothetical protein [Burkholderiales bacterium 8X]
MPVYSMTGFASAQNSAADNPSDLESKRPAARIGIEIRSVNSRFLDLTFKLPDELRQYEPSLRELLGSKLKRGKIEVRASLLAAGHADIEDPSMQLLQRLNSLQDGIKAWLPGARELSVSEVLRLAADESGAPGDWSGAVQTVAQKAVKSLVSAREREGERLARMLLDHVKQIEALVAKAKPLIPNLIQQQRTRFLERWQDAMGATGVAPESAQDRALSEATAFAIRIDVAEELTRLGSHLEEIERLLSKGGEVGKRLDFLIQELHREANTLGSKSATLELSRIGVDMKVLIEQMREQVQNLE